MLERIQYQGWTNVYRISNGTVELLVLADAGPRVLWFGFIGEENVFHQVTSDAGLTGGDEFRLYGGHRLWVWPEVERTYFPDNLGVAVAQEGERTRFTAAVEKAQPGTYLQKEIQIELQPAGSRVAVTHRITNHHKDATELSPWAPTMMRQGGRAILPLPPRVPMDKNHFQSVGPLTLWSFTDFADTRWRWGTEYIQLRQDAQPKSRFPEQMTGLFNPAGWGAYFSRQTLFVKRAEVIAGAAYPDFGCNFEVFTNPQFLELETLGPKVRLQPGHTTTHTETWELFRGIPDGEDESWIRSSVVPVVGSQFS